MPFNRSACLQFIFGTRQLIDKPPLEAEFPGTILIAHSGNRSRQRKPQAQFCAGTDNSSELQCLHLSGSRIGRYLGEFSGGSLNEKKLCHAGKNRHVGEVSSEPRQLERCLKTKCEHSLAVLNRVRLYQPFWSALIKERTQTSYRDFSLRISRQLIDKSPAPRKRNSRKRSLQVRLQGLEQCGFAFCKQ